MTHYRSGADFAIPLTQGFEAIVDEANYAELLAAGPWQAFIEGRSGAVYARRRVRTENGYRGQFMHTYLVPDAQTVDHRNGDSLDNRKANLRPATTTENNQNRRRRRDNTSGYKGVWTRGTRWHASIRANGQRHYLGSHSTPDAAARAYDAAARELHGEFAALNFPDPGERAA